MKVCLTLNYSGRMEGDIADTRAFPLVLRHMDTVSTAAAPIPPPRKLTPELLAGQWEYHWGGLSVGWIRFTDDGCYFSCHGLDPWPSYAGLYSIHGDTLILRESRITECGCPSAATEYPVSLSTADYPVLKGACNTTVVKFVRR